MLRVLGTIQNSQWRNAMKGEMKDLKEWVNEIHDGMYNFMVCLSSHLFDLRRGLRLNLFGDVARRRDVPQLR